MISKYKKVILDKLLDKYENSKSFTGDNKVQQKFTIKVSSLFPNYMDHSNYEVFQGVNEAITVLGRKAFIIAKANSAQVYHNVILNVEALEEIYSFIGRTPKKDTNRTVTSLLEKYKEKNYVLDQYIQVQFERINSNKSIQYFSDDIKELENILIAVEELLKVEQETFVRDFSIRVFKDSKIFERISSKVISLLYEYGDFPDKAQVLGNLNIIKNPTYVNFKGAGSIIIKGQRINLASLRSDIAISSELLSDIDKIEVVGKAVITIENLTSFHTFKDKKMFAIYLGGYHNNLRRAFIKKIYQQNPKIDYFHFGDIDAGGFYILEHLKKETGVDFKSYKMDLETLITYHGYTKKLTEHDKERLLKLKDSQYAEVIAYMLRHDCKLEQEAINVG